MGCLKWSSLLKRKNEINNSCLLSHTDGALISMRNNAARICFHSVQRKTTGALHYCYRLRRCHHQHVSAFGFKHTKLSAWRQICETTNRIGNRETVKRKENKRQRRQQQQPQRRIAPNTILLSRKQIWGDH